MSAARIPRQLSKKIYEMRQYSFAPNKLSDFRRMTEELLHLRTKHSRIVGYWMCELGALNKAFHIWEYDSLDHRTKARSALVSDPTWISDYLKPAVGMLDDQKNCVCRVTHGDCSRDWPDSGSYQYFQLKLMPQSSMSGPTLVDAVVENFSSNNYGQVMAAFAPLIGDQTMYWIITRHENANEITDKLPDLSRFSKDAMIKNCVCLPLSWNTWNKKNATEQ